MDGNALWDFPRTPLEVFADMGVQIKASADASAQTKKEQAPLGVLSTYEVKRSRG